MLSCILLLQAVAAQHQLQYQAAAMQAQAMHAAAANAAWNQSNNPYLSGLCFPYNLYGAAAPQQLYAAYARSAAPSLCLSMVDKTPPRLLPLPGHAACSDILLSFSPAEQSKT